MQCLNPYRKRQMNEAKEAFEALLVSKGKSVPEWDGSKYKPINIQTYWRWFLMGWQLRGVSK